MPGATIRLLVLASSHDECTITLRPRLSGSHSAEYPQASTRCANSAPSAAVNASIGAQTPSLPSCIATPAPDRIDTLPGAILALRRADRASLRLIFRDASRQGAPTRAADRPCLPRCARDINKPHAHPVPDRL